MFSETILEKYVFAEWIYTIAHVFGILAIFFVGIWMGNYGGGFGFQDNPSNEFHWHPLMLSIGILLLNGEAIMIYRGLRDIKKVYTKAIHASLQFCGFLFICIGGKAIYDSRVLNKPAPKPHLLSIHSWIGLTTIVLFILQLLAGFMAFYWPGFSILNRKRIMPFHRANGLIIFTLSFCAALMGLAEYSAWTSRKKKNKF